MALTGCLPGARLFASNFIEYLQNLNKQVNDVQIEIDDANNVVLRVQRLHNHVGVVDDEEGKEKSAAERQHEIERITLHEHLHDASNDEQPQEGEQHCAPRAEIAFAL